MKKRLLSVLIGTSAALVGLLPGSAHAQTPGNFSLQVTPTPLVANVKPGQPTEVELKVRNSGTTAEELKIELRSFSLDPSQEEIKLDDAKQPDIAPWVSFSAPTFTVKPGQWFTQKVRVSLPKETGFSYSFAILISRKQSPQAVEGGRPIKGSVAVFGLVNVNRPGATRKLDVGSFSVGKHTYEYLPAELNVQLKNSGNTIVQPYGNIFIQRRANDKTPIATLPVNPKNGYILPGSTRSFKDDWTDGFPFYKTTTDETGKQQRSLTWDWSKLSNLRIGRYTAKLVAVYNDGQRDVPVEGQVAFWVFPWKILGGLLIVLLILLFGLFSLIRHVVRFTKRSKKGKTYSVRS